MGGVRKGDKLTVTEIRNKTKSGKSSRLGRGYVDFFFFFNRGEILNDIGSYSV